MEKREGEKQKGNLLFFLIALLGAFLLWMYAIGYDTEINETLYTGIPVELIIPQGSRYTVADQESFSVNVDVKASGTRAALNAAVRGDFHAYVDVSTVSGPGYQTLPVNVVAPNGLTVSEGSISVQNVTLFMDTFTSRTINIQIEKTYTSSYALGHIEQSLYAVNVYGPKSVIGNAEAYSSFELGEITGGNVHVSGEIRLRDATTKAQLTNPYITMSANTVDVTFHMYGSKAVSVCPELIGGLLSESDIRFSATPSEVYLSGPLEELEKLGELRIPIDESKLEDKLTETVNVKELLKANYPELVYTQAAETELTYTVVLPSIRFKTVQVPISQITVYNLPEDGSVHAIPIAGVEVTLFGTADAVQSYDGSKLHLRVDYKTLEMQLATGEYTGIAEIDTGDSRVCIDGSSYIVSVRLVKGSA